MDRPSGRLFAARVHGVGRGHRVNNVKSCWISLRAKGFAVSISQTNQYQIDDKPVRQSPGLSRVNFLSKSILSFSDMEREANQHAIKPRARRSWQYVLLHNTSRFYQACNACVRQVAVMNADHYSNKHKVDNNKQIMIAITGWQQQQNSLMAHITITKLLQITTTKQEGNQNQLIHRSISKSQKPNLNRATNRLTKKQLK